MRKSERLAVTAHHEAGHAVIARKLGLEVTYVTIIPDLDYSGFVDFQNATYPARNADLATQISAIEKDVMVKLAGPAAESRYRPPSEREAAGWWHYARKAVTALVRLAIELKHGVAWEPERAELFDQLSIQTEIMVDEHWPAIQRVAHGLLDLRGSVIRRDEQWEEELEQWEEELEQWEEELEQWEEELDAAAIAARAAQPF